MPPVVIFYHKISYNKAVVKVKPLENSENTKMFVGLATLLFLLVVGTAASQIPKPQKRPEKVLGAEKRIRSYVPSFKKLETQVVDSATGLAETLQDAGQQALGVATQSATSFLIENSAQGLMKQIEKLPEAQQQEVKQQLCK